MNQQNFIKILGLTLLVVAATVGIAFIVTPSPIDGGRFCLALLPVVFAELLLGGVILMSGYADTRSARLLFGLSRAWTVGLYLGFTILAAILVALEGGFPVFYRQERVGMNGRLFSVIKFRSMRKDAEQDGTPRWASGDDCRVTRVGRFIRKNCDF